MRINESDANVIIEGVSEKVCQHPEVLEQYKRAGLSHLRYRWDILWSTVATNDLVRITLQEVSGYANDAHIDTVLRRALGKDYH